MGGEDLLIIRGHIIFNMIFSISAMLTRGDIMRRPPGYLRAVGTDASSPRNSYSDNKSHPASVDVWETCNAEVLKHMAQLEVGLHRTSHQLEGSVDFFKPPNQTTYTAPRSIVQQGRIPSAMASGFHGKI